MTSKALLSGLGSASTLTLVTLGSKTVIRSKTCVAMTPPVAKSTNPNRLFVISDPTSE